MRPRITLATFRKVAAAEETMMRAVMPRVAQADPTPLPRFAAPAAGELLAQRAGSRLVKPLTFTLAEVARA